MTNVRDFWRPIINDFNPVGRIRPEDGERFFVDRHEDDPTRSIVQRMKLNLQNSIEQPNLYKALLTGHVGSGKSSELMRLGRELADDFFVITFDAELSLATDTANHFDVLLGMGVAIYAAAEVADLNPNKKKASAFVSSFAKFIKQYEKKEGVTLKLDKLLQQIFAIVFVTGMAGAASGAPIALVAGALAFGANQVLKATRLELNVEDKLVGTLELPQNRQEIIGKLNDVIDDVQKKAGKPLLIIMDGLDKVSAARAELLFADSALLTEPVSALIYAAPIEFYHRLSAKEATNRFDDYRMLMNPAVQKRPPTADNWKTEREPDENGLEVMFKVLSRRLASRNIQLADVITDEAKTLMSQMSGGVMRELIRSFRDAATSAQLLNKMAIDIDIVQSMLEQQQQEIAPQLNINHRDALRNVLIKGALNGGAQMALEDELLRSLHLLSYVNTRNGFWFDAHPIAFPLL